MKTIRIFILMLLGCFAIEASANVFALPKNNKWNTCEVKVPAYDNASEANYLLFQVFSYIKEGTAYERVYTSDYMPENVMLTFRINLYDDNSGIVKNSKNVTVYLLPGECDAYATYPCGNSFNYMEAELEYMSPTSINGYIIGFDYLTFDPTAGY